MIDLAHRRLDHLGHFRHDRAFGNCVHRLLDNAQGLAHLGHANQIPVVGVAIGSDWNFEIEFGVRRVGLSLAQIPLHAAGAQDRAGYAERDAIGARDHAHILGTLQPDAIGGEQFLVFIDFWRNKSQKILYFLFETGVSLILAAANAKRMRSQARPTVLFENLEDLLSIPKRIEKWRHRSDIERVRAQPKLVAGDAVQLGQNYANILRSWRRFYIQQFFNRLAVTQAVRYGGDVVHPVDVGIEHRVGAVLGDFFHAPVQVSDDAFGAQNFLAVKLQDDAQHAVRRRMLR